MISSTGKKVAVLEQESELNIAFSGYIELVGKAVMYLY